MKSKLVFLDAKSNEYKVLQQVLSENATAFSVVLESDLVKYSWGSGEILVLDFSDPDLLARWTALLDDLPELVCIGLFHQQQEEDALRLLEAVQISDYLIYETFSLLQWRKCLFHLKSEKTSSSMFLQANSAQALQHISLGDDSEEQAEYLQAILNLFPQPVFIKNSQHQWLHFNQAFCDFMGQTEADIKGKTDRDFFPDDEVQVFWTKDKLVFESGQDDINEELFTDAEGVQHTILTKKILFVDQNKQPFLIGSITNIDQLKQQEQEIALLKNNLEKRVQERTQALQVSNQELQREIEVRKRAEYQARQSQERLLAITQAMPDPSLVLDLKGNILAAYASDENLLFLPLETIIHQNVFDILPFEFHESVRIGLEKTLDSGEGYTYEYMMTVPAGKRWFEARTARVKSQEDKHVIFAIRDITAHKEDQQALFESEQKFKAIFNQTIQLMAVLDTQGHIIETNTTALNMVGAKRKQVQGKLFWQGPWWQHSPDLQEQVKEAVQQAALGALLRFEVTHEDVLGQTHFIDFSISPLRDQNGKIKYLIPTGHDITVLKQTLEALASTEEQFSKAFEYAPIGKALISLQGRFFRSNKAFSEIFGYAAEELAGLKFKDLTHPDEVAEDILYLKKLMSHEIDIYTREKRYLHKNGNIVWGKLSLVFIRDTEGTPLFLIAQVEDITRRKQALAELKQAEERFKHLTTSLEDVIYTNDADLVCTSIYGSWSPAFNFPPESLIGKRMQDMPYETIEEHLKPHQEALKGRAVSYEWQVLSNEGPLYFQTKITPLKNEQGEIKGVVGAMRDITLLKAAEIQISASLQEKELLLREIYHRVKNNLQIISSMLNLQARKSNDPHTISLLKETKNRVISMAMVHERLYESTGLSQLNFASYIKELCSHLVNVYAIRRSEVELSFDCAQINLNADIAIPCGLILNEVVSNALKHAFPEGHDRPFKIKVSLLSPKSDFALLSIHDNGVGLPASLDFDTLKSLGLRLVHRLSQQIDGEMTIDQEQGTRVQILFPLTSA